MPTVYGKYTVEILDAANRVIAELSEIATGKSMKFVRNGTYEASFSMDLYSFEKYCKEIDTPPLSILGAGINTLRIKRLETVLFAGMIEKIGTSVGTKSSLTVRALGWLEYFRYRYTADLIQHTSKTYGAILRDTITNAQAVANGSLNVTLGTDDTTGTHDKKHEYKNVKDALIEITELSDGPDFEFTPTKVFNVYTSMGAQRSEFEFNFPGNIKEFSVDYDSTRIINQAIVRGSGTGPAQNVQTSNNSPSQIAYRLRQAIMDKSDVEETAILVAHGVEAVDVYGGVVSVLALTMDGNQEPYIGSYWLGDRVKVAVTDLDIFQEIQDYYRIDEINVSIGDNDNEDVKLKVAL